MISTVHEIDSNNIQHRFFTEVQKFLYPSEFRQFLSILEDTEDGERKNMKCDILKSIEGKKLIKNTIMKFDWLKSKSIFPVLLFVCFT